MGKGNMFFILIALILSNLANSREKNAIWGYEDCPGYHNKDWLVIKKVEFDPPVPTSGTPTYCQVTYVPQRTFYVPFTFSDIKYNGIKIWEGRTEQDETVYAGVEKVNGGLMRTQYGLPGKYSSTNYFFKEDGVPVACYIVWFNLRRPV